jgi:Holliday junction resolvase RusA-like endonuclease
MDLAQIVKLTVPGVPKAWARPRAGRSASGKPFFFEDKKVKEWRNLIILVAQEWISKNYSPSLGQPTFQMLGGTQKNPIPLSIKVAFFLPRPKKYCRKKDREGPIPCTSRPDLDNLYKGIVDALQGVILRDDALIWSMEVYKLYHSKDGRPWTDIEIMELSSDFGRGDS